MPPQEPSSKLALDAHPSVVVDVSLLEEELRSSFVQMVNKALGGERTSSFSENDAELGFALGEKTPENDAPVPEQIAGRFTVQKAIGRGGFGTVYLAHDESLDRDVAIKVPHEKLRSDPQLSSQCLKEARLAAKLRHPSIVTIFDISENDGRIAYIVQEYVQGATLYELIAKQRFSVKQTILLVMKVAEAIAFAHARGVYHRDLKPANLIVDDHGGIRVLDFGLAVDEEMQRSARGQVAGTIAYMSPEQIEGRTHHLDGRTDIWSLGVIFYELLTGRRPFRGSADEVSDQVIRREAAPPRQFMASIPKKVEACCLKCLSKSVSNRYATALDLLEDLKEIIETEILPEELPGSPLPAPPHHDTKKLEKDTTKDLPKAAGGRIAVGWWIGGGAAAIVGLWLIVQSAMSIFEPAVPKNSGAGRINDPLPPGRSLPFVEEGIKTEKKVLELEYSELIVPVKSRSTARPVGGRLVISVPEETTAGVFAKPVMYADYSVWLSVTPKEQWKGRFGVLLGANQSTTSPGLWIANVIELFQESDESWCMQYKYIVIENNRVTHETPISSIYRLQKPPSFSEVIEIRVRRGLLDSVNIEHKEYNKIGTESIERFRTPKDMEKAHGIRSDIVRGQVGILCSNGQFEVNDVRLWEY